MWVEGITSHKRVLNDLAKLLCTSNKDELGKIMPAKNWELVYPLPHTLKTVSEVILDNTDTSTSPTTLVYQAPDGQRVWSDLYKVNVYEDNDVNDAVLVPSSEYTIDYKTGTVTFSSSRTNRIRADYTYVDQTKDIYQVLNSIQKRVVLRTTIPAQNSGSADDPFGSDADQHANELTIYVEMYQSPYIHNPEKPITDPDTYSVTWTENGESLSISGMTHDGYELELNKDGVPRKNYHYVDVRYFDRWDPIKKEPGEEVVDYLTCAVVNKTTGDIAFYANDSESLRTIRADENGALVEYVLSVHPDTGVIGYFELDTSGNTIFTPFDSYKDYDTTKMVYLELNKESGVVIFEGGHASPWHKWSWYRDFEEVLNDMVDTDLSQNDLSDGVSFRYLETVGLDKQDIPIKFHASVDNRKAAVILQGDPSLNYDNYLISFGYLGAVESYYETYWTAKQDTDPITGEPICVPVENREYYSNDTAGNFLLTVGSSTAPATKVNRDPITGTVLGMEFNQKWGVNTADGINDFSMFKTRSGLYFQKHHPAFVTPEQFLDKEMFNPSRWTGAYNLSQVHVVHGHDGYRGILKNVVVVDDAALDHENELIVKEKQAEQKVYKFFAINTPYGFIRNSPNVQYGIAILKE